MDETSIELGVNKKKVLAKRGTKVLYNVTSSTRDHITTVLTVNAAGNLVSPRCFFRGQRNMAATHLASLPSNGQSGAWSFTTTHKGFVTAETFVDVLSDLVKFVEEHNIARPVILFLDGAAPHISICMAEYCQRQQIQPWLFKPNTTHLIQPLDLTVMKSLKDAFKRKVTAWQQSNFTSLTKYTVVPLLRESMEEMLTQSPGVIGNGFRRAGLVPWDPSAPDSQKMLPSTIFAKPADQGKAHIETRITEEDQQQSRPSTINDPGVVAGLWPEPLGDGVGYYHEQEEPEQSSIVSVEEEEEEEVRVEVQGNQPQPLTQPSTSVKCLSDLPDFTPHNLYQFEAVFLTKEQVEKCEQMYRDRVKSSNGIYLAWKALKVATLPTEAEAVDSVLESHSPNNIQKRKAPSGRKVPTGMARWDPTSKEWMEIYEETAAKKAKPKTARKVSNGKDTASAKKSSAGKKSTVPKQTKKSGRK